MADSLGTIRGQMVLDVKQALAAYTQARQSHVATVTALRTGGAALATVGAGITAAGAGIAAGIGVAVDAAAQFERKLDYFVAVSGSTQDEYDAIRVKALQLGKDTIYSAGQIADSFIELGKSGVTAKQIIGGVGEGVAALASAADLPLDTAAQIMVSAVQTFGKGADEAVSIADKLSGAANASILDVQDLGVSLKYVGGVAHALGISFDDTNTALAILGQYGIKGSTAGTSLRQTLTSLTGSSKKATEELKDLGIITKDGSNKFFDSKGRAKSLGEIFDVLRNATKGLTQEQQIQSLKTIFQSRALSTVLALTKEGSKGFDTMAASINKTTAADVASKRLDNLSGDLEILRGNLETLAIEYGATIQDTVRGVVQGITSIIQIFTDLPDPMKKAIVIGLAIVAAFLIIAGVVITVVGAVLGFIATLFVLGPVISAIVSVVGAIVGAIASFGGALLAFLGPVGIVIAIIAVIVGALVWFFTQTEIGKVAWQEFCRFLAEAWANIVSVATDLWGGIVDFFSTIWTNIVAGVTAFIAQAVSLFLNFTPLGLIISHWGDIVGFFAGVWNAIVTGIATFVAGVISFFANFPENVAAIFARLPALIGFAIGLLLGTIVRGFLAIGAFFTTTVPTFIGQVIAFFQQLPLRIAIFLATLAINVVTFFTQMRDNAINLALSLLTGVITFFVQLPGRVQTLFLDMAARAIIAFLTFRARAIATAVSIISGIIGFFTGLPGKIQALFVRVVTLGIIAFVLMVARAKTVATNIIKGVTSTIDGLPGLVVGIFNRAVDAIAGVIRGAFNAAKDFAGGLWNGFKEGLGIHSPSYIEHAMWAITDVTQTETDRLKGQVGTLKNLGNGITQIGQGIGEGWGNGMDQGLMDLYKTVGATRQLENDITKNGLAGSLGVDVNAQRALLAANAAAGNAPAETNINTTIINPEPERASDSLPRSIRQSAYMVGS